jgi:hypothetical protein
LSLFIIFALFLTRAMILRLRLWLLLLRLADSCKRIRKKRAKPVDNVRLQGG